MTSPAYCCFGCAYLGNRGDKSRKDRVDCFRFWSLSKRINQGSSVRLEDDVQAFIIMIGGGGDRHYQMAIVIAQGSGLFEFFGGEGAVVVLKRSLTSTMLKNWLKAVVVVSIGHLLL